MVASPRAEPIDAGPLHADRIDAGPSHAEPIDAGPSHADRIDAAFAPCVRPSASRRVGSIEVITGSMFSGKTEELIRRLKRALLARQKVQAFKPRIDDRYDASRIVSHGAAFVEAVAVATSESLLRRVESATHVVGIDEAQFFDREIVTVAETLANRGLRVIVAGLDQDYLGRPFAPMPELMAIAEEVSKVRAVCSVCGEPASRSQRIVPDGQTVLVGGATAYEARCRGCFEPREARPSTAL